MQSKMEVSLFDACHMLRILTQLMYIQRSQSAADCKRHGMHFSFAYGWAYFAFVSALIGANQMFIFLQALFWNGVDIAWPSFVQRPCMQNKGSECADKGWQLASYSEPSFDI